ncbi:MAG: hypothetical protein ACUVQ1_06990 [Candidatus Kapaibacteriales bacterium]
MLSKRLLLIGKLIIFAWLTTNVSQAVSSERFVDCRLTIVGSLKIDVCGSENQKTFVLAVDLGQIYFADSLFGFNYELVYDTGNVEFVNVLYLNTLAEMFELKAFSNNARLGKVNGYAMTASLLPVAGNKPLLAFAFKWKNKCSDSALFQISYIEFTDEFKVKITDYVPTVIYGEVAQQEDRRLLCSFENKFLLTNQDTVETNLMLRIPNNSGANDLILNIISEGVTIDTVYSVTGNIIPVELTKYDYGYKIHLENINDNGQNALFGFRLALDTNKNDFIIKINPELDLYCKCITKIENDSLKIRYQKDTMATVFGSSNIDLNEIKHVYIINLLGQLKMLSKEILIDLKSAKFIDTLESGAYIMVVITTKNEKKIKMINIIN